MLIQAELNINTAGQSEFGLSGESVPRKGCTGLITEVKTEANYETQCSQNNNFMRNNLFSYSTKAIIVNKIKIKLIGEL